MFGNLQQSADIHLVTPRHMLQPIMRVVARVQFATSKFAQWFVPTLCLVTPRGALQPAMCNASATREGP